MRGQLIRVFWSISVPVVMLWGVGGLRAEPLEEMPFFQAIEGEWVGEGSLEDAEGRIISVSETWKAEAAGEGRFVMAGQRDWDGEQQSFRWAFSFNAALEAVECEYHHTGMDDPLMLEVSIAPERLALRAHFDGGGELSIVNLLTEEGMVGEISVKDAGGSTVMEGELMHRRSGETDP